MNHPENVRWRFLKTPWFPVVACVVFVWVAYLGAFQVPLLLDDKGSIVENPSIRELWTLPGAFSPSPFTGFGGRPLSNLSFAISYALSGLEPWGYHLLNLTFHTLAALTLFGVIRRTLQMPSLRSRFGDDAPFLAGVIALLWAVHPLQTQTVTYISQRTESLMALFYLLTLYCFIRGTEGRPKLWHPLAVVACLLGALSKETIVTAPVLVLLYDRTFVAETFRAALRLRWRFYGGLALTWLLLAWLLMDVTKRGVGFGQGITSFQYALTQCKAVVLYLSLSFWPHPLVFDRSQIPLDSIRAALPYALVLAALLVGSFWAVFRKPAWGFAAAWFFVILAPTSSFVPVIGAPIAENRPYLSLAGLITLVVISIQILRGRSTTRLICTLLVAAAVFGTARRNCDYQSEFRLLSDSVLRDPDSSRAHLNLANILTKLPGRQEEALAHYETALRLKPDYAEAHYNLGILLTSLPARQGDALAHYEAALRLQPDHAEAHNNLGNLLAGQPGKQAEALHHFDNALRLKPDYAEAHYNQAVLLAKQPNTLASALNGYETALRLKPDFSEAHYNLGILLASMPGRQADALAHFETALRLKPDYAEAHNNLANLLASQPGRQADALTHFETALRLKPDYAEAHNNMGLLLADLPERQADALAHYETALRLNPDYGEAHNNLANLLTTLPDRQADVLAHYEAALRLLPSNAIIHVNFAYQLEQIPGRRQEAISHYAKALELDPNLIPAREALQRLRQTDR